MILDSSIAIAVALGLTEVIKTLGLDSKYAPLLSVIIGLGISFLNANAITSTAAFAGIIYGLSACGLFSGAKTTLEAVSK